MHIMLYAIKDNATGHYLPEREFGVPATHTEPVAPTAKVPPRLFHTKHAAQVALTLWRKGAICGGGGYTAQAGITPDLCANPRPHRDAMDMEIVALALTELGPV